MPGAQTHRERVGDGVLIITVQWQETPSIEKTVYSIRRAQRKTQALRGRRAGHTGTRQVGRQREKV